MQGLNSQITGQRRGPFVMERPAGELCYREEAAQRMRGTGITLAVWSFLKAPWDDLTADTRSHQAGSSHSTGPPELTQRYSPSSRTANLSFLSRMSLGGTPEISTMQRTTPAICPHSSSCWSRRVWRGRRQEALLLVLWRNGEAPPAPPPPDPQHRCTAAQLFITATETKALHRNMENGPTLLALRSFSPPVQRPTPLPHN